MGLGTRLLTMYYVKREEWKDAECAQCSSSMGDVPHNNGSAPAYRLWGGWICDQRQGCPAYDPSLQRGREGEKQHKVIEQNSCSGVVCCHKA